VKDNIISNVLDSKIITLLTNLENKQIIKLYNSAHFLKVMNLRKNIAAWYASQVYVADADKIEKDLLSADFGCKKIYNKLAENESLKALLEIRKRQNEEV
jgi:hypothetical protein